MLSHLIREKVSSSLILSLKAVTEIKKNIFGLSMKYKLSSVVKYLTIFSPIMRELCVSEVYKHDYVFIHRSKAAYEEPL